ncbi:hypothetical protein ACFONL_14690 [Camelimonas fluminis]|uniref:Uncharacterized protein n=1 Tax=Camelimonas fluminis TaxID=1576911 RepID=A0ABV7UJA8_9HYPH|nr:hypothetical protein [Camelimonas fluminis]
MGFGRRVSGKVLVSPKHFLKEVHDAELCFEDCGRIGAFVTLYEIWYEIWRLISRKYAVLWGVPAMAGEKALAAMGRLSHFLSHCHFGVTSGRLHSPLQPPSDGEAPGLAPKPA